MRTSTRCKLYVQLSASLVLNRTHSCQTLLHPFRPLSTPYPPGELPPPSVLDELTHQIVKYAYRPSPVKRSSRTKLPPKPRPHEDGWTHTWNATRRKLFRLALAESQHAHGLAAEDRKLPRHERLSRPGLKRMDSMDFLDQADEEDREAGTSRRTDETEGVGRAIRLSTSLQNSARANPLSTLSRTQSDDVTTTASSSSGSSSTATLAELPTVPAAITVTPSSPVGPTPPLRRRGSSRASQPRSSRPSLLQRGRSFTASDLEADASILPDSPVAKGPSRADPSTQQDAHDRTAAFVASTSMSTNLLNPQLAMTSMTASSSRLTRSQSSGDNLDPHAFRTSFLADRQPSTIEKSALALPFEAPAPRLSSGSRSKGEWSDSDEECSTRLRHVKKVKPVRAQRPKMTAGFQPSLQAELLSGPALRSPFEEKTGMGF